MKIRLLDYANTECFVEIPDDTEEITIQILSGDMVMLSPVHYDSSRTRIFDFDDGIYCLPKDKFAKLNTITNSYELYDL